MKVFLLSFPSPFKLLYYNSLPQAVHVFHTSINVSTVNIKILRQNIPGGAASRALVTTAAAAVLVPARHRVVVVVVVVMAASVKLSVISN